jgi:hypothetical protein
MSVNPVNDHICFVNYVEIRKTLAEDAFGSFTSFEF